jgi:hypothetical protein
MAVSWTAGRSGPASPFGLDSSVSRKAEKRGENRCSQYRHILFDEQFQEKLTNLYRKEGRGWPPVAPAMLAMALILEAYTGVSDDEVIEATMMDRRWQLVLDCVATEEAPCQGGGESSAQKF